jgi:hypothetical protein
MDEPVNMQVSDFQVSVTCNFSSKSSTCKYRRIKARITVNGRVHPFFLPLGRWRRQDGTSDADDVMIAGLFGKPHEQQSDITHARYKRLHNLTNRESTSHRRLILQR